MPRRDDVRSTPTAPFAPRPHPRRLDRLAARGRRPGPGAAAGLAGAARPAARMAQARRAVRAGDGAVGGGGAGRGPGIPGRLSPAADQPATAAAALNRLAEDDRGHAVLTARLAWREGRLTEALRVLDEAPARGGRLRKSLAAELAVLDGTHPRFRARK